MKKLFAVLVLAAALSACATAGSGKINWDNARQVKTGMTTKEVKALMGPPYAVKALGDDQVRYVWVHVSMAATESAALTFKHGVLVETFQLPEEFK